MIEDFLKKTYLIQPKRVNQKSALSLEKHQQKLAYTLQRFSKCLKIMHKRLYCQTHSFINITDTFLDHLKLSETRSNISEPEQKMQQENHRIKNE